MKAIADEMYVADRALVVMACGTGKTLVELWAAEALKPARVLVLVPTLHLLYQTFHEWREQHGWGPGYRTLCVCSDHAIGKGLNDTTDCGDTDEVQFALGDLDFPTSTDPATVNRFLDAAAPGSTSVIFCTYQSAAVVGEALSNRRTPDAYIDLGIFDEAHKTVGDAGRAYSYGLTDRNLRLKKRLFFTATPRVIDSSGNRDADGELSILSMDDVAAYGKRVHELSFAEAARRGIIVPYKVIISVVNDRDISSEQLQASMVNVEGVRVEATMVANQIALASAVERFGIRKAITFHRTVEESRVFSLLPDIRVGGALDGFERLHVSGSQAMMHRNEQMARFAACEKGSISNAKCLTEGVDVPSVDLVAFMSPKESHVDIVQAAGRSMRLAGPEKTTGYILLPIHVNPALGESVDDAVKRSDFKTVFDVLRALMANDSELEYLVNNPSEKGDTELGLGQILGGRVEFVGGASFMDAQGIYDALEARLLNGVSEGKETLEFRFSELASFRAKHGHCDVPAKSGQLGMWCSRQRTASKRPDYPEDRRRRLEALGFQFVNLLDANWEANILELSEFKAKHGHCDVPKTSGQLGMWCSRQRTASKHPDYPEDRRRRLEALGFQFVNLLDANWEANILELSEFKAKHGHCDVPQSSGQLGTWCSRQRTASKHPDYPEDRRRRLEALGFRFDLLDAHWEANILELSVFKAKHGHCDVPKRSGQLGMWCSRQRKASKHPDFPEDRRRRLEALGFQFVNLLDANWEANILELSEFKAKHGHCDVPKTSGQLGMWCSRQRKASKRPDFPEDRRRRLEALGFKFNPFDANWEARMLELSEFKAKHGHCDVPKNSGTLGKWCSAQRLASQRPEYPEDRRRRLEALGFRFASKSDDTKVDMTVLVPFTENFDMNEDNIDASEIREAVPSC